jgi:hypothetical protein
MKPELPEELASRARSWDILTRWERSELGRSLRRLGMSYGEIMQLVPVPKSTLSSWCGDIRLDSVQIAAIKARTGSLQGIPRDTQRKRRDQVKEIRAAAATQVPHLMGDPLWVAGTTLYWGEGAKTKSMLAMANTDPRTLRLFVRWVRRFHDPEAAFVLSLHLHHGNDERFAKEYWVRTLDLPQPEFYETYEKPPGTGHRKNRHEHGVCRVLVRRSADALHRTLAWIDTLARAIDPDAVNG